MHDQQAHDHVRRLCALAGLPTTEVDIVELTAIYMLVVNGNNSLQEVEGFQQSTPFLKPHLTTGPEVGDA